MGMQIVEQRNHVRRSSHRALPVHAEAAAAPRSCPQSSLERAEKHRWMVDESWTAIVGYIAELALPGEG